MGLILLFLDLLNSSSLDHCTAFYDIVRHSTALYGCHPHASRQFSCIITKPTEDFLGLETPRKQTELLSPLNILKPSERIRFTTQ
jgi:hypothetical protein